MQRQSSSDHTGPSLTIRTRLYIIEGIITVAWAACCIFVVPKNYETAYFLNASDKAIMRRRAEEMEAYSGGSGHYSKKEIKEAAKDIKSWAHGVIQIAVVTILYGRHSHTPAVARSEPIPADKLQQVLARSCQSSLRMGSTTLLSKRSIWSFPSTSGVLSSTL